MRTFVSMSTISIRPIRSEDDARIASIIRSCLNEFEAPTCGSALGDPEIDFMSRAYSGERSAYFVAEENGVILGGAGIAQLENANSDTCELRKMYLSKQARGKGVGNGLMQKCLEIARSFGFEYCYLETFPTMLDAQKLYKRSGFYYLDASKGGTGHTACTVWMQNDLNHAD